MPPCGPSLLSEPQCPFRHESGILPSGQVPATAATTAHGIRGPVVDTPRCTHAAGTRPGAAAKPCQVKSLVLVFFYLKWWADIPVCVAVRWMSGKRTSGALVDKRGSAGPGPDGGCRQEQKPHLLKDITRPDEARLGFHFL